MKEWYSASELSELLDKSLRSIQKSSKLQSWNFQIREGKTREYHLDNLPLAIKSEILNKLKDYNQKQDICEDSLSALTKLNASDLQKIEIRENIIKAFKIFKNDTGLSNSKAGERFCEKYNNKELLNEPLIHQSFSYISRNTLLNWQKNYKTAGVSGLADNYGNRKGMTKVDSNPQIRDFILGLIYEKPHVQSSMIIKALRARFNRSILPSYRTIQNWVLKWKDENQSLLLAITNPDAWKSKFQAAGGSQSENIIRLNQRWEFDSTPTDIMLNDGIQVVILEMRGLVQILIMLAIPHTLMAV